eukprot:193004-Prorocentrum_minimum.AAC.1
MPTLPASDWSAVYCRLELVLLAKGEEPGARHNSWTVEIVFEPAGGWCPPSPPPPSPPSPPPPSPPPATSAPTSFPTSASPTQVTTIRPS